MPLAAGTAFCILYNDLTPDNVLTTSSEDATYTHANLEDTDRQTFWKAGATGDQWVKLGNAAAAMSVAGFALLNHNLQTAGVTSVVWAGSANDSTWTTLATIIIADIGDSDYFYVDNRSYKYNRLTFVGSTAEVTLGRVFFADLAWNLRASTSRMPVVGSAGGLRVRVDVLETLAGIEHITFRGLARRLQRWMLSYLGSTDQGYLEDVLTDAYATGKMVVISDPTGSSGVTYPNGKAIHARVVNTEQVSEYQGAAQVATTLDFIEVL